MNFIRRQVFWFVLAVLMLDLIIEFLTMQLPSAHRPSNLGQQVAVNLMMAVLASLCAAIGGTAAFRLFPNTRKLNVLQLLLTGVVFIIAVYGFAGVLSAAGLAGLLVGSIIFAFIAVFAAGRWMT